MTISRAGWQELAGVGLLDLNVDLAQQSQVLVGVLIVLSLDLSWLLLRFPGYDAAHRNAGLTIWGSSRAARVNCYTVFGYWVAGRLTCGISLEGT